MRGGGRGGGLDSPRSCCLLGRTTSLGTTANNVDMDALAPPIHLTPSHVFTPGDHPFLVNHTGVANDPSFVFGRTDVRSKASRRGARVNVYMQSDAAAYASAAHAFRARGSNDKATLAKLDERMMQVSVESRGGCGRRLDNGG